MYPYKLCRCLRWQQSSLYFQAKSAFSNVSHNIFFNGPRAGVVFNDGFIGGNSLQWNLMLNTCRESGDHGPFNQWDRAAYYSPLMRYGTWKIYDEIHHNFLLANYAVQDAVDTDDGSSRLNTFQNFLVYGDNGLKSDYGSHDNHHYENIYAFARTLYCVSSPNTDPLTQDLFHHNTAVMVADNGLGCGDHGDSVKCGTVPDQPGAPFLWGNTLYTPSGNASNVSTCGKSLAYWQSRTRNGSRVFNSTTVHPYPTQGDEIVRWARDMFGM